MCFVVNCHLTCITIRIYRHMEEGQYGRVQEDEQLIVRVFVQLDLDRDERCVGVRRCILIDRRHIADVRLISVAVEEVDLHLVDEPAQDGHDVSATVGVTGSPMPVIANSILIRTVDICCGSSSF